MLLQMAFHAFLWPSNTSLYMCTTSFLSVLPINGHLGCSPVLAIVNSASVTTGVHLSFQIMVFSGYMPRVSLVAQLVKNPPTMWETWVQSLGSEDPLEKGPATHSSILGLENSWTV